VHYRARGAEATHLESLLDEHALLHVFDVFEEIGDVLVDAFKQLVEAAQNVDVGIAKFEIEITQLRVGLNSGVVEFLILQILEIEDYVIIGALGDALPLVEGWHDEGGWDVIR
jgi:hypothetical protein